ncbi:hypothetical protein GH714_034582 [Hevea brasiliensis]|uniref:Retrotransposon gag domain-containing protein n=1 Tax=Hevea brasiliensis TaxID=3981 RepID=A0A6A6M7X7_HEVBR|nr:hypothetical protein GH714_034582 [Hevea brasiliensis]
MGSHPQHSFTSSQREASDSPSVHGRISPHYEAIITLEAGKNLGLTFEGDDAYFIDQLFNQIADDHNRDPAVPPSPPEEVADHDELHDGGDEHGDSASHGVSSAYVAPPLSHPPAPTIAPPVPPLATPFIPPIVPTASFQLNPDLGAFVAQVVTAVGSLTVREYVDQFEDLYYFVYDILPSEEAKCDRFKQGLHIEIRASITWFRGSNFRELVEAALNVEKVKQEEKEYEQKISKKHGQSSSQGFRERSAKRGGSSF